MHEIGIIQSRLLPRFTESYQWNPKAEFYSEFYLAKYLGFDYIELIDGHEDNFADFSIKDAQEDSRLTCYSICLDYLQHLELTKWWMDSIVYAQNVWCDLQRAQRLDAKILVLPFVDNHSLVQNKLHFPSVKKALSRIIKYVRNLDIQVCIENDLPPNALLKLLKDIPGLYVCYDTGNSTAMNYDPIEEIQIYGKYIAHVHVKDRLRDNGDSVFLGTGNTKFETIFRALARCRYKGNFTLQGARHPNNEHQIDDTARQFQILKGMLRGEF